MSVGQTNSFKTGKICILVNLKLQVEILEKKKYKDELKNEIFFPHKFFHEFLSLQYQELEST